MAKTISNRIFWIDLIRAIACFSVVFLHAAAGFLPRYGDIPAGHWWTANIYDSAVRMCVPLFFMVSGYLLLSRSVEENWARVLLGRCLKIAVPLVAWYVIYLIFPSIAGLPQRPAFVSCFSIGIRPAFYHLWFLYAMIVLYFAVPFFQIFASHASRGLLWYFIVLWIAAVGLFPLVTKLKCIENRFDFSFIGYSGYLVLGYLLGKMTINKKATSIAGIAFVVSVAVTAWGIFFLTHTKGRYDAFFYGYKTVNVICMSAAAFVLLRYWGQSPSLLARTRLLSGISSVAKASFGIYLVHAMLLILVRRALEKYGVSAQTIHPAVLIPLTAIITFVLSYIVTAVISKIPLVKRIVLA